MACDVHKVNVEGNVMSPEAVAVLKEKNKNCYAPRA